MQHWKEGGHDKLCKLIKKAGGAEQYNANKKYAEAVTVAAEACADDTKGQTCYICTEALHWKTKEGLVRGCSCRGTAGFAHVSCLEEQAKILIAKAEENNLGNDALYEGWARWHTCSLCEQDYHGVVACALGWASWKTYLGRPEMAWCRGAALTDLGIGLSGANHHADALVVRVAQLAMHRRLGDSEERILAAESNLAESYQALGRFDQALRVRQEVYSERSKRNGEEHEATLLAANNYANSLIGLERYAEAKAGLRKMMPVARRVLGDCHDLTLSIRWGYAETLYKDDDATLDDLREAVTTLEETVPTARRVFGNTHPEIATMENVLQDARAALRAREAPSGSP